MPKRLQVILQDSVYREIRRVARARHMTMAEWVRQALDLARRREPSTDVEKKLAVVRTAVQNTGPTADIDMMLDEIERGYLSDSQP